MKRYRVLRFQIDGTRNLLSLEGDSPSLEKQKEEMREHLVEQYGIAEQAGKFERYMEIEKPSLSVVDEHSYLMDDFINAYVLGSFYSALTGACCLGERIFNTIIFRVLEDFRTSEWYKKLHGKAGRGGTLIDWVPAIQVLTDWRILDEDTRARYTRLSELRNESVHYQRRPQDLRSMSKEAIELVISIISRLFGISQNREHLIYFEVPGELYVKKDAESVPMVKGFFLPCGQVVGYRHTIERTKDGKFAFQDLSGYEEGEITDEEFVALRKEATGKG